MSEYENLIPKGAWFRSRDQFRNFGTPITSLERLKLETAYLVQHYISCRTTDYLQVQVQG